MSPLDLHAPESIVLNWQLLSWGKIREKIYIYYLLYLWSYCNVWAYAFTSHTPYSSDQAFGASQTSETQISNLVHWSIGPGIHVSQHIVQFILPYNLYYCTIYITIQFILPYNLYYCTIYITIQSILLYNLYYRTIYITIQSILLYMLVYVRYVLVYILRPG